MMAHDRPRPEAGRPDGRNAPVVRFRSGAAFRPKAEPLRTPTSPDKAPGEDRDDLCGREILRSSHVVQAEADAPDPDHLSPLRGRVGCRYWGPTRTSPDW